MAAVEYAEARSTAWRYRALGSRIGVLQLAHGRLTYSEDDEMLFDVPLAEVDVVGWPSAAGLVPNSQVRLRVEGESYRICFVEPSNATGSAPDDENPMMPSEHRVEHLLQPTSDYEIGERLGAAWRELLGG